MNLRSEFNHLCQPIRVGKLNLKNRMVLAPAHVTLTTPDGGISPELVEYFEARAQGGVAMIIMGVGLVKENGRAGPVDPRMDQDRHIPSLYRLTERIHFHKCIACAQLFHAGRYSRDGDPISASDVAGLNLAKQLFKPRAMTIEEIEDMIDSFANAAFRAKKANFDMVEIHGATGYLVLQFYSPRTNTRSDEYGGSFENRIRFPLEIVRRIKKRCGDDFPVGFRMVGDELLPDGFPLKEAKEFAKRLQQIGVAYISVTAGTYETRYDGEGMWAIRSPVAPSIPIAAAIKKEIKIPVFANGQINDPVMMEQIFGDGKADLIALARPLFSDPDLPNKIIRGKYEEIRLCTHCCQCFWNLLKEWPVTCFQNPEMGKEKEYNIATKASKRKRVLVIGGGPGGLEAARVTALRGHDVTLWEKENMLGGQLLLASMLPGKEIFRKYTIQWLVHQCEKIGVNIQLNKVATVESVKHFNPEAVIIATGAVPHILDIPGGKNTNVWNFKEIITGKTNLESRKVIIIGGGLIGTEIAELLATKGNTVVLLEMLSEIAINMDPFNKAHLLNKIIALDVTVLLNTAATEIKNSKVVCVNRDKETLVIDCDDVVMATGTFPNNGMVEEIEGFVQECYSVGDCVKPRRALDAIHEASYFARVV